MQTGISATLAKKISKYLFGLSHYPSDSFQRGLGHDGYPLLRVMAHTSTQLLPAMTAGMAWGRGARPQRALGNARSGQLSIV